MSSNLLPPNEHSLSHLHNSPSSKSTQAPIKGLPQDEKDWLKKMEKASKVATKQSQNTTTVPSANNAAGVKGHGDSIQSAATKSGDLPPIMGRHLSSGSLLHSPPLGNRGSLHITDWRPFDRYKDSKTLKLSQEPSHQPNLSHSEVELSTTKQTQSSGGSGPSHHHELSNSSTTGLLHRSDSASRLGNNGPTHKRSRSGSNAESSKIWSAPDDDYSFEAAWRPFTQNHAFWQWIIWGMNSSTWMVVNGCLTIFSLFARDFCQAWLPKEADDAIAGILFAIFLLFSIEIILNCIMRKNYIFSFLFLLDAVGTVSLIFDIPFLAAIDSHSTGVSGKVQRSASILRVSRFSRMFRILRLVRVIKIFRFSGNSAHTQRKKNEGGPGGQYSVSHQAWGEPSASSTAVQSNRIGLHLSEIIDKRVVLMLLTLIIVMPLLQADPESDQSKSMGLEIMDSLTENSVEWSSSLNTYLNYHAAELIYLHCGAASTLAQIDERGSSSTNKLRSNEIESYASNTCSSYFNVRQVFYLEAAYSMLLTLIVVFVFGLGSLLISKDVHSIIVAPLERMSAVVQRLASTMNFLPTSNNHNGGVGRSSFDDASIDLFQVIEKIIENLTHIFRVQPDASLGGSKGLNMLAGSKSTEIRTADSVLSIEVIERPRVPEVNVASLLINDDGLNKMDIDLEVHKELASMESLMHNPSALAYFKAYLHQALLMENLQFYSEAERYRTIVRTHAHRLYSGFVSTKSLSQVNLPSDVRHAVEAQLDNPNATMFDAAQAECYGLMKSHRLTFLQSRFAHAYIKTKNSTRLTASEVARGGLYDGDKHHHHHHRDGSGGGSGGGSGSSEERRKSRRASNPISASLEGAAVTAATTGIGKDNASAPRSSGGNGSIPGTPLVTSPSASPVIGSREKLKGNNLVSSPTSPNHFPASPSQSHQTIGGTDDDESGFVIRKYVAGVSEKENLGDAYTAPHVPTTIGEDFDALSDEVKGLMSPGWEAAALSAPVAWHAQTQGATTTGATPGLHAKRRSSELDTSNAIAKVIVTPNSPVVTAVAKTSPVAAAENKSSATEAKPTVAASTVAVPSNVSASQVPPQSIAQSLSATPASSSPSPSPSLPAQNALPVFGSGMTVYLDSPLLDDSPSPAISPDFSLNNVETPNPATPAATTAVEATVTVPVSSSPPPVATPVVREAPSKSPSAAPAASAASKSNVRQTSLSTTSAAKPTANNQRRPSASKSATSTTAGGDATPSTPVKRHPSTVSGNSLSFPSSQHTKQHSSSSQMTAAELEAEALKLMLPSKSASAKTGDRDLDEEIDRLVNPRSEEAALMKPGGSSSSNTSTPQKKTTAQQQAAKTNSAAQQQKPSAAAASP